jgi:hypothetical protein
MWPLGRVAGGPAGIPARPVARVAGEEVGKG